MTKLKRFILKLPLLLLLISTHPNVGAQTFQLDSTTIVVDTVTTQIDKAWEVLWGADNFLWVTDGPRVKRIDPNTGVHSVILHKPHSDGLGMVLHPDFPNTPEVFIVFDTTRYYKNGQECHLYKYQYSITGDSLYNEQLILKYPHAGEHSGGRMVVTHDNKILLTTADYAFNQQNTTDSLKGRILRINLDGSAPADNPRPYHYEWSYGQRNSQGITMGANNIIYTSEHGQVWDELNIITKNANHGWPVYDAYNCIPFYNDSCISPTFNHSPPLDTTEYPPAGLIYYNHDAIPEWKNSLIVSGLRDGALVIHQLNNAGTNSINDSTYFKQIFWRIRDVCNAPDGSIYMITNDRDSLYIDNSGPFSEIKSKARIRRIYNPNYIATNLAEFNKKQIEITTYPNPTKGTFSIKLGTPLKENVQARLYSLIGQPLSKFYNIPFNTPVSIDASQIPKGIYYLQIKMNDRIYYHKVNKN